MSLLQALRAREADGRPIRVGLIGAGKFGSMYLSQVNRTPGVHLVGLADLSPPRAAAALDRVGWAAEQYRARSFESAVRDRTTHITADAAAMIASPHVDVVIEATGSPAAGIAHALLACEHGTHIVMVNVEADVLAGPYLAEQARKAGIVYSMASGDQPALIAELVDWARTIGFDVVCAGKGTRHLPAYHASTPDTVWDHYGFTPAQVQGGDFNAQMFNSFLDGTKSSLEMAAVANSCELEPPVDGLAFPACGVDDLPTLLRPQEAGGILAGSGTVEVVSSIERDERPVFRDLRWGVYVVIEAPTDYVRNCFSQYGLRTDPSGSYAAMYRPYHLIGLELGTSVANIGVRGEATGATSSFSGDVAATAKRALRAGEKLDGEGGFTVYGKLRRAADSLRENLLPIGLAHGVTLRRDIAEGAAISWEDVEYDPSRQAVQVRREMEELFHRRLG